ncbi:MAG: methyltransferase domain-containing protein [Planctomycetes bacterium]|nr:methyltransferase domain-containing protein [Planctomycetota bacterium]
METAHLDQLIQLEDSYWWHVAKRSWATQLLTRYVPPHSKIVEGGIGAGGNLVRWQQMGYQVAGLDCMSESIEHANKQGLSHVQQHDLHQPWPFERSSADAIVLLDVLEHLKHPSLALRNATECLTDTGKIIFTVPAYPMLFSDWDERLGHFRRYTSGMLQQHAREAGLRVLQLSHWNSFTLPVACVIRLLRRLAPSRRGAEFPRVSPWVNQALIRLASVEQKLGSMLDIPVGLSLVGVLGK